MQMIRRILLTVLLGLVNQLSGQAMAGPPTPYADFEAKRVRPPAPGTRKRITVQIEPTVPEPVAQPAPQEDDSQTTTPYVPSQGNYAWFWDQISPELAKTGPGRLDDALSVLRA
jgi:hypothetical protein